MGVEASSCVGRDIRANTERLQHSVQEWQPQGCQDREASDNERLSIEQAKTISGLAGNIIDIYKTQLDAVKTLESLDNVGSPRDMLTGLGVTDEDTIKQIGY